MTNNRHGQVPEALNQLFEKLEDRIDEWSNYVRVDDAPTTLSKYTAGAIKDLRAVVTALYHSTAHVQKPAEIEHVADDVSKNGAESNMSAKQPAPAPQQEAQEPVAWYVTGCGRLLDEDEAKAEARHIGGTARAMPLYTAPQADSVTAPAGGAVAHTISDAQIEAMPVWRNFVGLWPESRREIVDAVVDLLTTPPTQATDSVLEDAARSAVRVERRVMAPCTK